MTVNNETFAILKSVIETRRTLKPEAMNGNPIPAGTFDEIVNLADWAPTHGRTEPWRFFVYNGQALRDFCKIHADLYKTHTPEENFNPATYENILHKGDKASHLIVACMKRGTNPKIPAIEEIASASASVENVLLGAAALGVAAMWNTGGMAHSKALKNYLKLDEEDHVLGLVYMGYSDEPVREGKRLIPIAEKVSVQ